MARRNKGERRAIAPNMEGKPMKEFFSNSKALAGSQPGEKFSDAENALIELVANRRVTLVELRSMFPGRTDASIKNRLARARKEMGIRRSAVELGKDVMHDTYVMLHPDTPPVYDDWPRRQREMMTLSSARLLEALQAA